MNLMTLDDTFLTMKLQLAFKKLADVSVDGKTKNGMNCKKIIIWLSQVTVIAK